MPRAGSERRRAGNDAAPLRRLAHRPVCACWAAVLLTACPQEVSFVEHYADRIGVPDTGCVLERLQDLSDSNAVQQLTDEITLGVNHRFIFESQAVFHALSILVRPDESANFRHTAWAPNHRVSELQEAERSITEVESALSGQCGLAWNGLDESCHGRNCGSFALAGAQ